VLAIFTHKLSYSVRDSMPVILIRRGFAFEHVPIQRIDKSPLAEAARREDEMERVVQFIAEKCIAGLRIGKKDLDNYATELNMSRDDIRERCNTALGLSLLIKKKLPIHERRTNRTEYLAPFESNPANPAESRGIRRKGSGTRNGPDAANTAADGTSIPPPYSKPAKRASPHGTVKANRAESGGKTHSQKKVTIMVPTAGRNASRQGGSSCVILTRARILPAQRRQCRPRACAPTAAAARRLRQTSPRIRIVTSSADRLGDLGTSPECRHGRGIDAVTGAAPLGALCIAASLSGCGGLGKPPARPIPGPEVP